MCSRSRIALSVALVALAACGADPAPPAPNPATTRPAPVKRDAAAPSRSDGPAAVDGDPDASAGDAADAGAGATSGPAALALAAVVPGWAPRGQAIVVELTGTGFGETVRVLVNGTVVPAMSLSSSKLRAEIPATVTADVGFHAVWVEDDDQMPAQRRSNAVYLTVAAPRGWPEVIDFLPDNGAPGERIRIVGFNLTAEPLEISDLAGHKAQGGVIGTLETPLTLRETVEFTIPADWQSGPLAVGNSVGRFRTKAFNVGRNLAQLPGVKATASSEYGGEWTVARGADNDLRTSWFTAKSDCVSAGPPKCMTTPWFMITLPAPQTITRVAVRGSREYTAGYDFLRARLEVLGDDGALLWSAAYELPQPDRDLDLVFAAPVANATAVRFRSERDESEDPGFGELEIFGP